MMNVYGVSGLWCLIKTANEGGCDESKFWKLSLVLMMIFICGSLMIIIVYGFISMTTTVLFLFKSLKSDWHGEKHRKKVNLTMKEIVTVLIFPLIYCICTLLMLVDRIYSFSHERASDRSAYYSLWIVHSIADPIVILLSQLLHSCLTLTFGRTSCLNNPLLMTHTMM